MADYRALQAVSDALVHLLTSAYTRSDFDDQALEFTVYGTGNFESSMKQGVSVFLYRVTTNGSHRIPRGRLNPEGTRDRTQLPVDLHYMLTVWADDPSLQHRIAGWLMRVLEDTPIIPYGELNVVAPSVFHIDETVELIPGDLPLEDMLHLWEAINETGYRLSLPYVARNVYVESRQSVTEGAEVDVRLLQMRDRASIEN